MSNGNEARKLAKGVLFALLAIGLAGLFVISILLTPIIFVSYLILQKAVKNPESSKEATIRMTSNDLTEISKYIGKEKVNHGVKDLAAYIELSNKDSFKTEDLSAPTFKSGLTFSDSIKNAIKLIITIPKVFVFFLQKGLDVTGLKSTKTEKSQDVSDVFNMLSVLLNRIRRRGNINISQMKKDVAEKLASNIKSVMYEHVQSIEEDMTKMVKESVDGFCPVAEECGDRLEKAEIVSDSIISIIKLSSNTRKLLVPSSQSKDASYNKYFCQIVERHKLFKGDQMDINLIELEEQYILEITSLFDPSINVCIGQYYGLPRISKSWLKNAIAGVDVFPRSCNDDNSGDEKKDLVTLIAQFITGRIISNLDANELANFLACDDDLIKQSLKPLFIFSHETAKAFSIIFKVVTKINDITKKYICTHCKCEKEELESLPQQDFYEENIKQPSTLSDNSEVGNHTRLSRK